MSRLFLALELPDRLRRRLSEEADRLKLAGAEVRWSDPRTYHVPMKLLGEVDDRELLAIHPLLDEVVPGVGALHLVAKGLIALPTEGEPRVLACGIAGKNEEETEELLDLRRRLERGFSDLGFRREKGVFRPQVVLGRVRGPEHLEELESRMGPTREREFGHFAVKELVLFSNARLREGEQDLPMHRFPLA